MCMKNEKNCLCAGNGLVSGYKLSTIHYLNTVSATCHDANRSMDEIWMHWVSCGSAKICKLEQSNA